MTIAEALLRWGASLAGIWLLACSVILVLAWSSLTLSRIIYLLATLGLGAATWGVFAWDKHQAIRQGPRVPEATLHALTLLGGWTGAFLAQRWLRHKSQQRLFQASAWGGFLLNVIAFLVAWGWL